MLGSAPNAGGDRGGSPPGDEVCGGVDGPNEGGAGSGYWAPLDEGPLGLANP